MLSGDRPGPGINNRLRVATVNLISQCGFSRKGEKILKLTKVFKSRTRFHSK